MTTMHATSKAAKGGFYPMIIVRNTKGQCVGSKGDTSNLCADKLTAEIEARVAALRLSLSHAFLRVA